MNKHVLNIKLGALAVIIFFLCFKSATTVIASFQFYGANNFIQAWQEGIGVKLSDIDKAESFASNAFLLHDSLALYSDTLSTILQWKALQTNDNELKVDILNRAERYNLRSTTYRPSWPVAWVNLAYIKWLKGEFDADFQFYLSQASKLGPYTDEVHVVIAAIGLNLAKSNVREFLRSRALFKKHVILGIAHPGSRAKVITYVENTGTKAIVCTWLIQKRAIQYNQMKC